MCFKFFKTHSPLFCLKHHPRRGKLRLLCIVLCILRIAFFISFAGYFVYNTRLDHLEFEKGELEQQLEGKRSSTDELLVQQRLFYSSVWTTVLCFGFCCSYGVMLFAAFKRSRFLILTWLGCCWFLPLVVIIEIIAYFDTLDWYVVVAWFFILLFTVYEIWVFTHYEKELKLGEEVHLETGRNLHGLNDRRQRTGSASTDIRVGEEPIGALGELPSYRIAEKTLQKSGPTAVLVEQARESPPV